MPVFIIAEDVLDAAIADAVQLGAGRLPVKGLNAPLDEQQANWVNQSWDIAEGAVRKAWESGKTAATELLDQFHRKLQELDSTVGSTATAGEARHRRTFEPVFHWSRQCCAGTLSTKSHRRWPRHNAAWRDHRTDGADVGFAESLAGGPVRVRRRRLDLDLRRVRAGIAHGHRPEVASDTSSNNTLEGLLSRLI